jgi:hypothetical protein
LRFLDPQLYPEWDRLMEGSFTEDENARGRAGASALRLPSTEEERRAGFYFCNSLIQLMENVYLDLELATESNHPDNRGWMNIFHHWTWSPMFRATWAISAATFGRRFQSFCETRLAMSMGTIVVRPIWNESEPRDASDLKSRLEQLGDSDPFLNFVEAEQALLFIHQLSLAETRIAASFTQAVSFRLEVESLDPRQETEMLSFGVGYALLGKSKSLGRGARPADQILLFRIQDHLRHLGLGRNALLALLEAGNLKLDTQEPATSGPFLDAFRRLEHAAFEHPPARRFVQEFRDGHCGFAELVDSVLAERENSRRLRD